MYLVSKKYAMIAVFLASALPAFADIPYCSSGNLASLIGVTCDISPSLQFTFDGWQSEVYTFSPQIGYTYVAAGPAASSFTLTVLSNGFMLSGPGQTITGPGPGTDPERLYSSSEGILYYTLFDPLGFVTGESVTSAGLSATGSTFSLAVAMDTGAIDEAAQIGGSMFTSTLAGGDYSWDLPGGAFAWIVQAEATDDTASWAGSSTFTFTNTTPLPEPTSFLLFGTIACLLPACSKKSQAYRFSGRPRGQPIDS